MTINLAELNQAIEAAPHEAKPWAQRGEAYRLAGQFGLALADFTQAITLQPDYAWAIAHRGVVYRRLLRYHEAEADLSQAIALKPNYTWAMAYRAVVYGVLERYTEAVAEFAQVVALDESYRYQWGNERGFPLGQLGRYAEAIQAYHDALQARPDNPLSWYMLVVTKAHWQGLAQANNELTHLNHLLEQGINLPDPSFKVYALGGLAALHGNIESALSHLQTAVQHDPDLNLEMARYDLAWVAWHGDTRWQRIMGHGS